MQIRKQTLPLEIFADALHFLSRNTLDSLECVSRRLHKAVMCVADNLRPISHVIFSRDELLGTYWATFARTPEVSG